MNKVTQSPGRIGQLHFISIVLAIAATVGPVFWNISQVLATNRIMTDGHPPAASIFAIIGVVWMKFVCPLAAALGVASVAYSFSQGTKHYLIAICLWTVVNLIHAFASGFGF
jgi:hypothetical protein